MPARLDISGGRPIAARGHMPFKSHRTQAEVRQDQERTRMKKRMAAARYDTEPAPRRACPHCGARFEYGCAHYPTGVTA